MKFKKLLCVVVCVLVVLGGIVCASCGKKHYNLTNLATDYSSGKYKNISFKEGRYVFNFDEIKSNAYSGELNEITVINQNLTAFLADSIFLSSQKGNAGVTASDRDSVQNYLTDIKNALNAVDDSLDVFIFTSENGAAEQVEQQRERLKSFYDSLNNEIYKYFVAISNLSQVYANIYFKNYSGAENVNYYSQYVQNKVNIDNLSNRYVFNARVAYMIFCTSQVYLIQNFRVAAQNNLEEFTSYQNTVESLEGCKLDTNKKFSNTEETKLLAVRYYNGLALLHNDYNAFVNARDVILNSTKTDYNYDNSLYIIENYKSKINELNSVLIELHSQVA